ncbi:Piso0_002538 [Millerozyma farinosa CBS 7064]|uniref:Piso0_002538 protein n=1 Tax=Pichia sorbitophila (strain ATCC MYA-4447 / BCRC 22081 / CBS 7064 / NBRC 10061 / NRRL Y-12695) TaxID=559304 RepID=G8YCW1_PICSO|nr:Piso0_002538 [Millerozyma farinosa CBS 7064]
MRIMQVYELGEERVGDGSDVGYVSKEEGGAIMMVLILSFSSLSLVLVLFLMAVLSIRRKLGMSDRDIEREEENQVYMELDSEEQELYFQSKEFLAANPYFRDALTLSQNLLIQEKGVQAWEFVKDAMLTNNDLVVVNRSEITFFKQFECSIQTNLPMPTQNNVYYFESKIYSLPDPANTRISIGLSIKPYPWFRLPGRHANSICYDSNGYRRFNQPLQPKGEAPFPELIEGDVVGVGYRVRSGTFFFTRNGKKVNEQKIGGHIKHFKVPEHGQLFPTIGASNLCSVHVNLGQIGYVFVEANVKKWGYGPLEGNGPAPPAYNKYNSDVLLERSEIDDDNDLSERENDFPPNFWEINPPHDATLRDKCSYDAYADVNSHDERITLNTISNEPPSYDRISSCPSDAEDTASHSLMDASCDEPQQDNVDSFAFSESTRDDAGDHGDMLDSATEAAPLQPKNTDDE